MADPRKKALHAGLQDLVWKTYELEETVKNFGPESQAILNERMLKFIERVRELVPLSSAVEGVKIPVELLEYVDKGGNPNQYTAEVFRACTRDNQMVKGRVDAMQTQYDSLVTQWQQLQPQEAAQYKTLVAQMRQAQAQQQEGPAG